MTPGDKDDLLGLLAMLHRTVRQQADQIDALTAEVQRLTNAPDVSESV
jgi:hypothetical protein